MTIMQRNTTRMPAVIEASPTRAVWTVEDVGKMAQQVAASQMFGLTQAQAFVLMMLCQSEGLDPIQAVRRYHIVQGRPTMRSDAMLAEMQARGWEVEWLSSSQNREKAEARFRHPTRCSQSQEVVYLLSDAKQAGLVKEGSGWTKHPAAMLRARVISTACRMLDPGIIVGIYTPEEAEEDVRAEVQQSRAEALEQRLQAKIDEAKPASIVEVAGEPAFKLGTMVEKSAAEGAQRPEGIVSGLDPEWRKFLRAQVEQANTLIENECKIEGVTPWKLVAPEQVGHHLVNEEIEAKRLDPDKVFGTGGKRTNAKVRGIMQALWDSDSEDFRRRVIAYIGGLIDAATKKIAAMAEANLPAE